MKETIKGLDKAFYKVKVDILSGKVYNFTEFV